MFARFRKAWASSTVPTQVSDGGLAAWANDHMLTQQRLPDGALAVDGSLWGRPFQAGCAPSSRPYIVGMELMARAALDLDTASSVIVMHRSLKRVLDHLAGQMFAQTVDGLHTSDRPLPEEIVWLSTFRDVGWTGPSDAFWSRYGVLTDSVEAAREVLEPEMIAMLSAPPAGLPSEVPFLLAMTRGKLYLRMQLEAEDSGEAGHYALDAMKLFSARALKCFGR